VVKLGLLDTGPVSNALVGASWPGSEWAFHNKKEIQRKACLAVKRSVVRFIFRVNCFLVIKKGE
jgi:hypothetical protein